MSKSTAAELRGIFPNENAAAELRGVSRGENATAELKDIFPALAKYKTEHNSANLQNLCVEISEFCTAVYASTRSDKERTIYQSMLRKLIKEFPTLAMLEN